MCKPINIIMSQGIGETGGGGGRQNSELQHDMTTVIILGK